MLARDVSALQSLAIRTADGVPVIFLINPDFSPSAPPAAILTKLSCWLRPHDGAGLLTLPPRSVTTLFPAGSAPQGDDST
jgi:hypothetical protein